MQVWEWQKEKEEELIFPLRFLLCFSSILYFLCRDSAFRNSPVQRGLYKFLDYYVLNDSDLIYNDLFPNSLSYKCTSETQPLHTLFTQKRCMSFQTGDSCLSLIRYQGLNKFFPWGILHHVAGHSEMLQFTSIFLPSLRFPPVPYASF